MKKALKELIENAKPYDSSKYFNRIMFLSDGVYNGKRLLKALIALTTLNGLKMPQ